MDRSLFLRSTVLSGSGICVSPGPGHCDSWTTLCTSICILELFTGPQVYFHIYGYEPFQWIGARRYFGFRPIGFLEGGNQLGIWMATSALLAFSLWAHRSVGRILGIPAKWAALSLAAVTLLCQSAGSILLFVLLLPLAMNSRRCLIRATIATLLGGVVLFITLQLTHVVSWRETAQSNPVAHATANGLRNFGRESFAWRIEREESQMGVALHKPLFGSGEWDWWRTGGVRPWDVWTLVFGMYGMFGVFTLEGRVAATLRKLKESEMVREVLDLTVCGTQS